MIPIKTTRTLAIAAAIGVSAVASPTEAQDRSFGRPGLVRTAIAQEIHLQNQIRENVLKVDRLAEEMVWRYGRELRGYRDCSCSIALFRAMREHRQRTAALVRASRGTCQPTFEKAACAVRESLDVVEQRRKTAQVSPCVAALISDSCPPATFVHRNANRWRPAQSNSCNTGSPGYSSAPQPSSHPLYSYLLSRLSR